MQMSRAVLGDRHPRAAGLLTVDLEGMMAGDSAFVAGLVSCQALFFVLATAVKEDWGHSRPVLA